MANKQAINQIEADGTIYEFVDQEARDRNTNLDKKISVLNEAQTKALNDEIERAKAIEQAINDAKLDKEEGKGLSSNDFTDYYKDKIDNPGLFDGATETSDGTPGMVPAPLAGQQNQYFRGDGTWQTPPDTTYENATQTQAGLMSKDDKKKLDKVDLDIDELMSADTVFGTNTITTTLGNGKVDKTTFNPDGSITREITKAGADKITLRTVFNADGSITRTRS